MHLSAAMVSPNVAKLVEGWCEMAKVKRMMFGGAAKAGSMNLISRLAPKTAPRPGSAGPKPMQSAAKSAAAQAGPMNLISRLAPKTAPKQFMSDKLRGSPMPPQVRSAPTSQMAAAANKKMQATAPKQFMPDKLRGVGAATTGVARGMMKKGGAVKKATKK